MKSYLIGFPYHLAVLRDRRVAVFRHIQDGTAESLRSADLSHLTPCMPMPQRLDQSSSMTCRPSSYKDVHDLVT